MDDLVRCAIVGTITALFLHALVNGALRPARRVEHGHELRYSSVYAAMAWIILVVGAVGSGVGVYVWFAEDDLVMSALLTFGLLLVFGYWMVRGLSIRFTIAAEGIRVIGRRKDVTLHWRDIQSIRYSHALGAIIISTASGPALRMSRYLQGLRCFEEAVVKNLSADVYGDVFRHLWADVN